MAGKMIPLSEAARKRIRMLLERREHAQAALQEFGDYLIEEYSVPNGWGLAQDLSGFILINAAGAEIPPEQTKEADRATSTYGEEDD